MSSEIGEKIRHLRKKHNLTQAQLAGDGITRNMLSLIENGSASPSIQTLEYISSRLGVSPAIFFMQNYAESDDLIRKSNEEIKALYTDNQHDDCIKKIEQCYKDENDAIPDEILLIAAECCMYIGRKNTLRGSFETASEYLRNALEYSRRCPFSTEWIDAQVYLFGAVIENSDCPIQSLDKDYYLKLRRSTGYELYNYLYAIRLIDDKRSDDAAHFLKFNKLVETAHKEHINAKFMMLSENRELKTQALAILCDMIKKAPSYPLDAISRYLILKDIEYSARALDDYEMAYKYATMRLKIISEMRD